MPRAQILLETPSAMSVEEVFVGRNPRGGAVKLSFWDDELPQRCITMLPSLLPAFERGEAVWGLLEHQRVEFEKW